jgi:uncharacterized protein involved in exopolysaccharide biosynthesis
VSLQTFIRVILRNWWLILLTMLLTTGSAAFFVLRQQPVYQALTTIELKPSVAIEDPNSILNVVNALTRRNTINTIARKATSSTMQEQVAKKLNVSKDVIADANITAIALPETNLIEIRAESTDPAFAAQICNTVAQAVLGQTLEKVIEMEVIDPATPPTSAIAPQPLRVITLALLFGLALGIVFALIEYTLQQLRASGWRLSDDGLGGRPLATAGAEQATGGTRRTDGS